MAARTENSIVIDAPIDLVWSLTNDIESWPRLFTEYARAEVLARSGNTVQFRLVMHPDENGNAWSWVSERVLDAERRIVHARRIETGWFEYMNIHWYYTQVDGGVRMRWVQEFEMKVDSPLNDELMRARLNANTPVQMRNIKQHIEQAAARVGAAA
jgi:aromatase